eukprot:8226082-Alexandrium_andersonii.AAC.1
MKTLPYDIQARLEHLTDGVLGSKEGVPKLLEALDIFAGVQDGDDMRRVLRKAVMEFERAKDESLG